MPNRTAIQNHFFSTYKCRQTAELLLCSGYIYANKKFSASGESRSSEQVTRTLRFLYVRFRGFTWDQIYSAASPSLSIPTVSTWKVSKGSLAGADQNIPPSGRNTQLWRRVNRLVFSKINSVSKTKTNLSAGPKSKVESGDSLQNCSTASNQNSNTELSNTWLFCTEDPVSSMRRNN